MTADKYVADILSSVGATTQEVLDRAFNELAVTVIDVQRARENRARLGRALVDLGTGLVERDTEVRMVMLAAVCRCVLIQHSLFRVYDDILLVL